MEAKQEVSAVDNQQNQPAKPQEQSEASKQPEAPSKEGNAKGQNKQPKENGKKEKQQNQTPQGDGKPKDGAQPKQQPKKEKKKSPMSELPPPPEFLQYRVKIWDEVKARQAAAAPSGVKVKVTLPDGRVMEADQGVTKFFEIMKVLPKSVQEDIVAAKVDGKLMDLSATVPNDCRVEFVNFDSADGKHVFWHSSAHILGQALERLYGSLLCIGPAVDDGFYYDMALPEGKSISQEDYEAINKYVDVIVKEKQPFEKLVLPKKDALEMFKYNKYKTEIISSKVPDGENCTAYRCGPLIDLCKGPHVPNTARVKGFSVHKNSSAYWLGKQENDSLQRVYGVSFPEAKQLKEWQAWYDDVQKRKHQNIGKQQELFFFHPLSPGSCFWLPHGARIYNKLIEYLRGEYKIRGFQEVITPNVFNTDLWRISGHLANYAENMFMFECEKTQFGMKPMNCPGHCLMFQHRVRSHKELPLRLADFGVLHRNEASGALHGLTRVRRFQQDDAHIFCAPEQIRDEIKGALNFLQTVYGIFGFDFSLELSTRPEKFLGEVATWNAAEKALEELLNDMGRPWKLNPGDGAFYGPKIDIHVLDCLKRSYQCATIQLDFQLPNQFGLEYVNENNELKRPVMIHRAILGSVERLLGILIEHTGGKWPFWLSPRQVIIIPVQSDKQDGYAKEVHKQILEAGYWVDLDLGGQTLPKKIREAQLAQYNFILVVGQQEMDNKTVCIRTRDDNAILGTKSIAEFIQDCKELEKNHK